jgi:D-beta-D-heptose 7-phosphate kinase/D-beta-D-heptose 1-phosphate adenosyltransferase
VEIRMTENKKTIVLSGGFDCLHRGHLEMFKDATAYGRVVVVLNSDLWLDRKKGYHLMNWDDRAEILRAIKYIDEVVPVDDANGGTVNEALKILKPDFFGNGGSITAQNTPERKTCEELGIKLIYGLGGDKIQSSSELIDAVVDRIIEKLKRW